MRNEQVGACRHTGRRLAAIATALVVVPLLMAACSEPGGPPRPTRTTDPTTTTPDPSCSLVDFETATLVGDTLLIKGRKPAGGSIDLQPVTYVQQPEYWQINVFVCNVSDTVDPPSEEYEVARETRGVVGTRGILVQGATRWQRIDVPTYEPEPRPPASIATATTDDCFDGPATVTFRIRPESVRAGATVTIDIIARHAAPVGNTTLKGGDVVTFPRPPFIVLPTLPASNTVSVALSGTGVEARAQVTATVAPDAKPGDVIEWMAPSYSFQVESEVLVRGTSTSVRYRAGREIRCSPVHPTGALIRQTVVA
jgi:hypothetical protein